MDRKGFKYLGVIGKVRVSRDKKILFTATLKKWYLLFISRLSKPENFQKGYIWGF